MSLNDESAESGHGREAVEDVISFLLHELRTPLAVVKSGVELLAGLDTRSPTEPKQRQDLLRMVDRNADLAIRLIERLSLRKDWSLSASRKDRTDLVTLVNEVVADLRRTTLKRNPIQITTLGALEVEADPVAARQIVANLLANAAKYSPPDAPIDVTVTQRNGVAATIVRDYGQGVPTADRELIFEKYVQGDASVEGVGLGLFVSRQLARAQGGDVFVRPAESTGSEFIFELPVAP